MDRDYRRFQTKAEEVAKLAGQLLLGARGRVAVREKAPADLVTDADFASQALITEQLIEAFPGHAILGEEEGAATDFDAPWRWIVDPLDGTVNFAHGFPFWCVSIALEHEGKLVVGVVHNPLTAETYSASEGQGSTLNGKSISVSTVGRLDSSLITTGLPTNFVAEADRQIALMRRFSIQTHSLRRTGSSAMNLAILASGGCEVCYATVMQPWDAAAGVVLVREAGGEVTRFNGDRYDVYGHQILATNGKVHGEARLAIEEAWREGS